MIPYLRRQAVVQAGVGLLACFVFLPHNVDAAPIKSVGVSVATMQGEVPDSVRKRIESSISAIGNRVFVGKEENIFRLNAVQYNKVLADIVNRVVIGYMVSDLQVAYGEHTSISVELQPVGEIIRTVSTEIDYGNLTEEAAKYVQKDTTSVPVLMTELLTGLPVDSVGWAESVSQSAGRDLMKQILPEFDAKFEVHSGKETKVRIFLIPKGEIVRSSVLSFHKTTIPRILLFRAASRTEEAMKGLEGLPVSFVARHSQDISNHMKEILLEDSFIKKYEIDVETNLSAGTDSVLKVDALTDHWIIKTEAWLDTGRDGDKNYAFRGMLGHYMGKHDVLFGEVQLYPGPMEWNVYGGWQHRFGDILEVGYKYDFMESANHVFARVPFGEKVALRYNYDFGKKESEYGLSYKIHNYITLEYVYNEEEGKWLRLIANL